MASIERSKFFQVRISEDELRMLNVLAEGEGLSASDIVRRMIRKAFIEQWNPAALEEARRLAPAKRGTKTKR